MSNFLESDVTSLAKAVIQEDSNRYYHWCHFCGAGGDGTKEVTHKKGCPVLISLDILTRIDERN